MTERIAEEIQSEQRYGRQKYGSGPDDLAHDDAHSDDSWHAMKQPKGWRQGETKGQRKEHFSASTKNMEIPINPIVVPREWEHKESLPARRQSADSEDNKVVGNPDRTPVNKQAAMIVQPVRSWIWQPLPPPKLATKEQKEIDDLTAQLKTERNARAASADLIGQLRQQLKASRKEVAMLKERIQAMLDSADAKDEWIRQLEDLKL